MDESSIEEKLASLEGDDDLLSGEGSLKEGSLPSSDSIADSSLEDELASFDEELFNSEDNLSSTEKTSVEDLSLDELEDELDFPQEVAVEKNNDWDLKLDGDNDSDIADLFDSDIIDETDEDMDTLLASDEIGEQFEAAQDYIDLEDNESARGILEEISEKGNEEQKRKAQDMMAKLI